MRHALVLLGLLLAACSTDASEPAATPEVSAPAPTPSDVTRVSSEDGLSAALEVLDGRIASEIERSELLPTDWLTLERAAAAHRSRARLSGSYDDYTAAEQLLERAFGRAVEGSGPYLERARLNSTLHRLPAVGPDLDHVADWPTGAGAEPWDRLTVRGGLLYQQGDIDGAKRSYTEAISLKSGLAGTLAALALCHWKTADFDSAEGLYRDVLDMLRVNEGEPVAWTHLQLGLMDLERGRYEEALVHYRDADAALPGYWLIHEHIAEIALLLGFRAEAAALYEVVIEDTDGSPEFLDARAAMLLEDGDTAAGDSMVARSREAYEARLTRFPEATYGHALDHFLDFGPPARGLELARANHTLRPNGDAKTGLIAALLGAGEAQEAATVADALLATSWRTADAHAAAFEAYEAVGRTEDAAAQRVAALALNPRAFE